MIYVASMNMRGRWAPLPHSDCVRINVTSSQPRTSKYRLALSPMTPLDGGYEGYQCFENFWQSGKRYEGQSEEDVEKMLSWWKKQEKGKRRYTGGKGMRVTHAEFGGKPYGYVESRKEVYVPRYAALVRPHIDRLFGDVENDIVIYDFDGPRNSDGGVRCDEVTVDFLREKIHNTRFPFGHGYVVAGLLAGIEPYMYTSDF